MNVRNRTWLLCAFLQLGAIPIFAQVADPVLNVAGVNDSQQTVTVQISDTVSGATIRYTTDGTTPTTASSAITSGDTLNIGQNNTLKVIAYSGSTVSNLVTAQYTALGLISSSGDHSVVINRDGTISAWGNNSSGQLGTGNSNPANLPTKVQSSTGTPFAGTNPVRTLISTTQRPNGSRDLQAGDSFSLVRKPDGSVWTWGDDTRGQQGDSQAQDSSAVPKQVPNLAGVNSVAAAGDHAIVAKSDGTVWAWGADDQSQCGDGGITDLLVPTAISGLSNIAAVYAGQFQGFAVDTYGNLYAWGTNDHGQLGDGSTNNQPVPEAIISTTGVVKVAAGPSHTLVLKSDGTVWASGSDQNGELGNGTHNDSSSFHQVPGLSNVVDIAAGGSSDGGEHSLALLSDGTVWTWGSNLNGELGDGNVDPGTATPQQIVLPLHAVAVTAVDTKSYVVLVDGTVRCFGGNAEGEMGNGNTQDQPTPVEPSGITNVALLAAGSSHVVVGTTQGVFYGWGDNTSFKLAADFTNFSPNSEVHDDSLSGFTAVASADATTLGLATDGSVWAVGQGSDGVLGQGQNNWSSSERPIQITALSSISQIAGGEDDAFAIDSNGVLWAWGGNWDGQLGVGSYTSLNTPTQVHNVQNVISVAGGTSHMLAVQSDGTVWASGDDTNGELGDGTTQARTSPIQIASLSGITAQAVAAGDNTSFVLDSNGSVWAWGKNDAGQLGLGTTSDVSNPTPISGLPLPMVTISARFGNAIGIDIAGEVWSWGKSGNADGTPVMQPNLYGVTAIATGEEHQLALDYSGTLWGWGAGSSGQLGNDYSYESQPIAFNNVSGIIALAANAASSLILKQDGFISGYGNCAEGQLAAGLGKYVYLPKAIFNFSLSEVPPAISLSSPGAGTFVPMGAPILFRSAATASKGTITKVDYYLEGVKIGTSTAPGTWDFSYTTASSGAYTFEAVGYDTSGASTVSNPVTIFVSSPISIDVPSGTLTAPEYISISGPANAVLYYTVDGTTPTTGSIQANGYIYIGYSQTINLQAYVNGIAYGAPISATYNLDSGTYPAPAGAPSAPTNFTATSDTSGFVSLNWTNASTNGSYTLVQQQNPDGSYTTVATLDPSTSSDTLENLTVGSSYSFRIVSTNTNGTATSSSSNVTVNPLISRYAAIDLGQTLAGIPAVNMKGTVVVGVTDPSGNYINGYRWKNGVTTALTTPSGSTHPYYEFGLDDNDTVILEQNSSALAYGTVFEDPGMNGVYWNAGDTVGHVLPSIAYSYSVYNDNTGQIDQATTSFSSTLAIDNGVIFGISFFGVVQPGGTYQPYPGGPHLPYASAIVNDGAKWNPVTSAPSQLGTYSISVTGTTTAASGVQSEVISSKGGHQIVYKFDSFNSISIYLDSTQFLRGDNALGWNGYLPRYINDRGEAIIDSYGTASPAGTFLYQNGTKTKMDSQIDLSFDAAMNSRSIPINGTMTSSPQLIGSTSVPVIVEQDPVSTHYTSHNLFNLVDPLTSINSGPHMMSLNFVNSINNNGAIAGTASYSDNTNHGILLLPAELAVDANRDGSVVMANDANNPNNVDANGNPLPIDTTSATKPFRFWVNDGQNVAEDKAALNGSAVTMPNYSSGTINFKGDLENFARLWIYTNGLNDAIQSGAVKVALQWQNITSGSPAINVYQSVESDGGTQYLNDDTTAANQVAGSYGTAVVKVTGTSPVVLPKTLFSNLSSTNPKTYCLFEGAGVGAGELVMVFEDSNGNVLAQGGHVYMNLKTVVDMYQQSQVTPAGPTDIPAPFNFPANGSWSSSTQANDNNGPPTPTIGLDNTTSSNFEHPADETKNCILFVHGWIVTPERYVQQSSECFKRLWWSGYKGLFASLRWPSEEAGAPVTPNYAVDLTDYFDTEYRGFKYAGSLKQYASSLTGQGYTVAVMAHSMGNIVTSEALKQGANFQYLMMDAAVSARCYDTNPTFLNNTSVTFTTPDLYTSGGYGGYFAGLAGLDNAYNSLDTVLLHDWTSANATLKGKTQTTTLNYVYTGGVGVQLQYDLSPAHPQYYYRDVFSNGSNGANPVSNYHESMTMYARTETDAAGTGAIEGAVNTDINMQAYFPGSTAHSPQFDYNVSDNSGGTLQFYKDTISLFNFQ